MQFLERLESNDSEERWLVQTGAEPHVAWFLDDDPVWLREIEDSTRPLIGAIHPRITAIRGTGWHGRRLVIECEDDRGPLLATAARELADPVERERWVIAQIIAICDGLATLRGRDHKFVHRQLEPERMYIDIAGRARLRAPIPSLMSGARAPRMGAGVVKGHAGYLAPEQARGGVSTPATDVFALATNLYKALSGKRPFARDSMMDELMAVVNEDPPPITMHATGLADILRRAFVKDPAERIRDPGTFAGELWQCVPDAVDYDEVVSDRIVEWRASATSEPARLPTFTGPKCRMKWEERATRRRSAALLELPGGRRARVVDRGSAAAVWPLRLVHRRRLMQIHEQLDGYHFDDRWLVHANGEPRCLWVIYHHHPPWYRETAILVQSWLGQIHSRVSAIHSVTALTDALLLEVEDDRGPTLAEAAEQIEDPIERERWVVSQIIALAQGLTALRERDPNYVYPAMYPERIFVDEAGHARLRHPIVSAPAPPTSRTGGADLHAIRYIAPEQVMNRELTPSTEVFVLVINLYLAISGRRPFAMEAGMGEMVRILQNPYDAIAPHTKGLLEIIDRAFAKVQAARIASPLALATELRACVPDAADYDAVTSDRIVMWRSTLRPARASMPRISRDVLSSVLR